MSTRDDAPVLLTAEGHHALSAELERLRAVRRPEVAARLQRAGAEAGDLGDNLDYLDALREQEEMESRIAHLESQLAAAIVLPRRKRNAHEGVGIGTWVELEDLDTGEHDRFQLVGSAESNPTQGRISVESPVGRTVAGHRTGDTVDVLTPRGHRHLRIVSSGPL